MALAAGLNALQVDQVDKENEIKKMEVELQRTHCLWLASLL